MQDLSQKVIETIKDKHLKPKPKWQFLLKDSVFWGVGILAILIGGLSFAVIIYMFVNSDWDVYSQLSNNFLSFFLLVLPYFWLIILGIFILIAYYNLKHTKKGYKFSLKSISLFVLAISIILGIFWYNIGLGQAIDNALSNRIPVYRQYINRMQQRADMWQQPDKGLLVGIVTELEIEGSILKIKDPQGKEWNIVADRETLAPLLLSSVNIEGNLPIIVMGQQIDDNQFQAEMIRLFIKGQKPNMLKMPERIFLHMRTIKVKGA